MIFRVKSQKHLLILFCAVAALLFLSMRKLDLSFSMVNASTDVVAVEKQTANVSVLEKPQIFNKHQSTKSENIIGQEISTSVLSKEQIKIMCKLKSARTSVPMRGEIQVFATRITPILEGQDKNMAWIKSSDCPDGKYSVIHFSDDGRVSKEIDCRKTTLTELTSQSGEQGDVNDAPSTGASLNMAISGNGYFVLQCLDEHLILTRDGKFQRDDEGHTTNSAGCILLNAKGFPFRGAAIDSSGCSHNGECVATLDPAFDEVGDLKYINSFSFRAQSASTPDESITKIASKALRPSFIMNALEEVRAPERGATSVSWTNHPHVNLDSIECE